MAKKQSKRQRDIKTKLMAAIAMLLVSSIMMVSSTYAWFTLSTAPEVTGINTAVGANGNLEMALLPTDGQTSTIDRMSSTILSEGASIQDRNNTWGNLVDVSDTGYGLQNITLYPSELNATDGMISGTSILKTPVYGADGRISELAENTLTGIYAEGSFTPDSGVTNYGVRAVGTASGMTDRQLAYRNGKGAASDAQQQAANKASSALYDNGSALANIAIKKGMNGVDATFDATDVAAMQGLIDSLKAADGSLAQLEKAYMQYILAYAASAATGTEDTVFNSVSLLVNAEGATLASVQTGLATAGVTLPEALSTAIAHYEGIVAKVNEAQSKLDDLPALEGEKTSYTWTEISPVLEALANPDKMLINGMAPSEVKENLNALVQDVVSGKGIQVQVPTGGGVFADIADQAGNYTADVNIDQVEYAGTTVGPLSAKMITKSSLPVSYLSAIGAVVTEAGAPAAGATGSVPMTDMFGYIIDMAFRTNAADSNLQLQATPTDRIYSDSDGVEVDGVSTMGHGASMTFTSQSPNFGKEDVLNLMDAIQIVFFDPDTREIIAYAKLDTEHSVTDAEGGITCYMYIYTMTEGSSEYVEATEGATHKQEITYVESATGTYVADAAVEGGYRPATEADADATKYAQQINYVEATEGATHKLSVTAAGETKVENNTIMALTQNQAHKLSCLVYLDGNKVTNADVAATGSQSVVGTMNLQFSSSAPLTPMNYTPLQGQGGSTETTVPETTVAPAG